MAEDSVEHGWTEETLFTNHEQLTSEERTERKTRLLAQGTPAIHGNIADAAVLKAENLFLVSAPSGAIPIGGTGGYGLYWQDARYLSGYEVLINGANPLVLGTSTMPVRQAYHQLTNNEYEPHTGEDERHLRENEIGIRWERSLDSQTHALHDRLFVKNYSLQRRRFELSMCFAADFADLYVVRGLVPDETGDKPASRCAAGEILFRCKGADGAMRMAIVSFDPTPRTTENPPSATFDIALDPHESVTLNVSVTLDEQSLQQGSKESADEGRRTLPLTRASQERTLPVESDEFQGLEDVEFASQDKLFSQIVHRARRDLHALRSTLHGRRYCAAGVPWFATLFGRDAIITALEVLAFDPVLAEDTLHILARYQGQREDAWRDEAPGKILHELRTGELARIGAIPHTPYYGTVDATPLFVLLVARHANWTGCLDTFKALRRNVERALAWMNRFGDSDGDGYFDYHTQSDAGLINQGWKDSGDAVMDETGDLAELPIALVEVQAYAWMAWREIAGVYDRLGEKEEADSLRKKADKMRSRFDDDYWMDDEGIYGLALQRDRRLCRVVTSNPGHVLWAGMASPERAGKIAERLMKDDMWSGWGIRTLSSSEAAYNPVGYHRGTVWPHDNVLIAAGFRRYGLDREAKRIFEGMLSAAARFPNHQLPEVFSGFERERFDVPVQFPVACHPQAWAAGSIPYMMSTMLGLEVDGFKKQLRLRRPMLPDFVQRLHVTGLRVGDGSADVLFVREGEGVRTDVVRSDGATVEVKEDWEMG